MSAGYRKLIFHCQKPLTTCTIALNVRLKCFERNCAKGILFIKMWCVDPKCKQSGEHVGDDKERIQPTENGLTVSYSLTMYKNEKDNGHSVTKLN